MHVMSKFLIDESIAKMAESDKNINLTLAK